MIKSSALLIATPGMTLHGALTQTHATHISYPLTPCASATLICSDAGPLNVATVFVGAQMLAHGDGLSARTAELRAPVTYGEMAAALLSETDLAPADVRVTFDPDSYPAV